MTEQTKLRAGKYKIPATLIYEGGRIFIKFKYNRKMIEEVKSMDGHKWHGFDDPPKKIWSVKNNQRNRFQLEFLKGNNPYAPYDAPLIKVETSRPLYRHQKEMVAQALTRHYCIFACEMGTGKTLSAIEAMEQSGLADKEVWYVGPKSGVKAVQRELIKWDSKVKPFMMTYERLVKVVKNWDGSQAPKMVIFDESSKIKNPTSQRSQAAMHLANAVRDEHGWNGYIIEMSGTPAPKAPIDWWHQAEVACPGFLKEGTQGKLKMRLCIIEQRESITGGVYPHIVTWLDDENKCKHCGKFRDDDIHSTMYITTGDGHQFEPSSNEVNYLYKRMKGLTLVQFKRDCLDLPEKQYEVIEVKPTPQTLRAAKMIKSKSTRAIQALTLLRELSDGFQYQEEETSRKKCVECDGSGTVEGPKIREDIDVTSPNYQFKEEDVEYGEKTCDTCGGTGFTRIYNRTTDTVESPKDQAFIDELDSHEDVGRYIVWGGFTGTIDRLIEICHKYGWATLRVDGRGYLAQSATDEILNSNEFLDALDGSNPRKQELLDKYPKVCFVGHPKAGGMALTLTASPTELFYSNTFDGEARMQAEDRFHRPGMDTNKGATIKDLIHLPTDRLVLENLGKKKKLQNLTMGQLEEVFDAEVPEEASRD